MPSKKLKSPSNYEVLKEVGKNALEGVKIVGSFLYNAGGLLYTSPTLIRRSNVREGIPDYENIDKSVAISSIVFITHTIAGGIYDLSTLNPSSNSPKGTIIFGAIPLLTNLGSGIYEYIRYTKKKMAGMLSGPSMGSGGTSLPLGSPHASSSSGKLEEKVEKDEIKIKDIPNPWDIEIPKIEDQKMRRDHYG